jgi:hypothetical protein
MRKSSPSQLDAADSARAERKAAVHAAERKAARIKKTLAPPISNIAQLITPPASPPEPQLKPPHGSSDPDP